MIKSCALRTRDKGGREHKLEIRKDDVSNALTSVTKDFLVIEDENKTKEGGLMTNSFGSVVKGDFKFVELFAGIGGVSFGFERVGGKCVMAAEYDPQAKTQFAQESYKTLHPDVEVRGDVCEIEAESVPDHDVLSFTTPCQSFSVAGKRGGFDDVRGTLYFEAMRIASEKKPKVIFMENVKGLVGHDKGKTLDTIVKVANECGYRVDFNVLNSKYFGVPQNRERFFMVGIREDLIENAEWTDVKGATIVPKGKRRISGYDDVKTFNFDWPAQDAVTTRLRDVLEAEVDEKYYLSEEKTAKLVEQLRDREVDYLNKRKEDDINAVNTPEVIKKNQNGRRIKENDDPMHALTVQDRHGVVTPDSPNMLGHIDIKGHDAIKRVYDTEAVGPTVTTMGGGHREPKIAQIGHTGTGGQRGRVMDSEGLSPCLSATEYKQPTQVAKSPKYRIRKLTPRECFRLQGFSDESFDELVEAGVSNSQLYKQAGNAVTVNVIHALGERLIPYLRD